jgi:hypothetical protein
MIRAYVKHLLSDLAAQVRDAWEAPAEVARLRLRVARLEGTVEAMQRQAVIIRPDDRRRAS